MVLFTRKKKIPYQKSYRSTSVHIMLVFVYWGRLSGLIDRELTFVYDHHRDAIIDTALKLQCLAFYNSLKTFAT